MTQFAKTWKFFGCNDVEIFLTIKHCRKGGGPFAKYGSEVFEHYWRNYLRNEDAERIGIKRPYGNLEEYFRWKEREEKSRFTL